MVAGLAMIPTGPLGAGVLSAEVFGSGIWRGGCHPRTAGHEAEELWLEVLNIGHEPHPALLAAESQREHAGVVPPAKPGEPAIGSELVGGVLAGHGGEHQVRHPDLEDAAVGDHDDQP